MLSRVVCIFALVSCFPSDPASAAPAAASLRSEIPIREIVLSDGVRRYAVTVTIDGRAIDAQLDTGSTGLRVLAIALPDATARGADLHYSYGSGVELRGPKIGVALSIGSVSGKAAIERVDRVDCTERQPNCPATNVDAAKYRIGGDGLAGEGFQAIIGTGLRDDTVGNPLIALGAQRWIVELPHGGHAGRLVLNPTDAEVAGYRSFDVLGDTNQIAACLVRVADQRRICAPAMVDSGASGLRVQGGLRGGMWADGTAALIALGDHDGLAEFPVTIGRRDQASRMFAEPPRAGSNAVTLNLGLAPFFHWSVLFDAGKRRVGVADL